MTAYLLATIDVESDDLWGHRPEVTFENIRHMPRLDAFFQSHGVRPTYLVSYPVATSEIGRRVFAPIIRSKSAEIGSHMHVWTTPPIVPVTARDYEYCPIATEISEDLLRQKMANITRVIGELTGAAPTSHRAGRYGFNQQGLRILDDLGYVADTSVTPFSNWSEQASDGTQRGEDFTRAPLNPYYPDLNDVRRPGASRLLEVPVSVFLTRTLPRSLAFWLAARPTSMPARALRLSGLARHAWLRPGRAVNGRVLVRVARALLAAKVSTLNVMFHSSEMAVGTSPHTTTQGMVEESYEQLDYLFRTLASEADVRPVTLSELAAVYSGRDAHLASKTEAFAQSRSQDSLRGVACSPTRLT